jgi:hypothetical protein
MSKTFREETFDDVYNFVFSLALKSEIDRQRHLVCCFVAILKNGRILSGQLKSANC